MAEWIVWVLVGWVGASLCFGAAIARWFRYLREWDDDHERWGIW